MGKRSEARITKSRVDALQPGEQLWDSEIRGFGVRRQRGRPHYFFAYRSAGRRHWVTLGEHGGKLTIEQARKKAEEMRGKVAGGGNLADEKAADKRAGTVKELATRFIEDYAKAHNKASTVAEYERLIRLHIEPALGPYRVNSVTESDIAAWHAKFKQHRVGGNRALALVKHLFSLAEKWGARDRKLGNPARHVEMFPEQARERLLTAEELGRLGAALDKIEREKTEHPSVITCIRLLILTDARLSEILTLKWDYVDIERGVARLPDSKTGPKTLPLGAPALELLSSLPRQRGNPYVCPGLERAAHFVGIQRPWRRIRSEAKLPDLRIHDLRHGWASIAAMAGDSLLLIGKVLGHRQARTTERYAHLQDDPVKAVAIKPPVTSPIPLVTQLVPTAFKNWRRHAVSHVRLVNRHPPY
jgi:integrase